MKLKTLTDLKCINPYIDFNGEFINKSELKQEAIKWVKEITKRLDMWYAEGNSPNDLMQIENEIYTARGWADIKDFIKYQNNVTEENLK